MISIYPRGFHYNYYYLNFFLAILQEALEQAKAFLSKAASSYTLALSYLSKLQSPYLDQIGEVSDTHATLKKSLLSQRLQIALWERTEPTLVREEEEGRQQEKGKGATDTETCFNSSRKIELTGYTTVVQLEQAHCNNNGESTSILTNARKLHPIYPTINLTSLAKSSSKLSED
tara:strand:- start:609 stop:1130 length:522 start_codon:yes stop_codon:yes gene_type:complete